MFPFLKKVCSKDIPCGAALGTEAAAHETIVCRCHPRHGHFRPHHSDGHPRLCLFGPRKESCGLKSKNGKKIKTTKKQLFYLLILIFFGHREINYSTKMIIIHSCLFRSRIFSFSFSQEERRSCFRCASRRGDRHSSSRRRRGFLHNFSPFLFQAERHSSG